MNYQDSSCDWLRNGMTVLVGVLAAVAVGALFFFGLLPFIATVLWVVLGLGIATLIIFGICLLCQAASRRASGRFAGCFYRFGTSLLLGVLGTTLATLASLVSLLLVPTFLTTLLIAATTFFLVWSLVLARRLYCCSIDSCD